MRWSGRALAPVVGLSLLLALPGQIWANAPDQTSALPPTLAASLPGGDVTSARPEPGADCRADAERATSCPRLDPRARLRQLRAERARRDALVLERRAREREREADRWRERAADERSRAAALAGVARTRALDVATRCERTAALLERAVETYRARATRLLGP